MTHNGNILVVDDTPASLKLLTGLLREQGYKVRPVPSGALALEAAQAEAPELVVLDVDMPGMDGYEVCARLMAIESLRSTPVIFISALAETSDKVKAFQRGGVDYITKPFQIDEVRARVETHLTIRRLHQDLERKVEELRELQRLRDNLTHMIVHDLRSPLTGVIAYLDLLRSEPDALGDDGRHCADQAFDSARTMIEMISSLLDVNRLESGRMPLDRTDADLVAITSNAAAWLGGLTVGRQVTQEAPDGPILGRYDVTLIQRVVVNLLGNALKFTPASGAIHVRVSRANGRSRVEVNDTGSGIPAAYLPRVFDKFSQAGQGPDRKRYSSGLGLAFCKLAVEAHGGTIGVRSELGAGSTFWFELPLDAN